MVFILTGFLLGLYRTHLLPLEECFSEWRKMALEQCAWSVEQAVYEGNQYVFVFGQLPKELYEILCRCINMEISGEDVYRNCSVLRKEMPLHFDGVSTPEEHAFLNLHVNWGHLVLVIRAAPDCPIEKLTEALANACMEEGWTFSDHTKDDNNMAALGGKILLSVALLYTALSL